MRFSDTYDIKISQFYSKPQDKILKTTCIGTTLNHATSMLFSYPIRILYFKILPWHQINEA